jgi:hypothetical protein
MVRLRCRINAQVVLPPKISPLLPGSLVAFGGHDRPLLQLMAPAGARALALGFLLGFLGQDGSGQVFAHLLQRVQPLDECAVALHGTGINLILLAQAFCGGQTGILTV